MICRLLSCAKPTPPSTPNPFQNNYLVEFVPSHLFHSQLFDTLHPELVGEEWMVLALWTTNQHIEDECQ